VPFDSEKSAAVPNRIRQRHDKLVFCEKLLHFGGE
jgi:hypothetical protein